MKPLILGLYLFTVLVVAQANPLVTADAVSRVPSSPEGHPGMGADKGNPCSSLAEMLAGTTNATDLNQYKGGDSFGRWNDAWSPTYLAATYASEGPPGGPGDNLSGGRSGTARNGEHQRSPVSHAILNSQSSFWEPDPAYRFNDSCPRYTNFDGAMARSALAGMPRAEELQVSESQPPSEAEVPEPQTIAMFLAGVVLLGLGARRRRNDPFD